MKLLLVDISSVFHPVFHAGADKPIGFAYDATIERVRRAAQGFDRVVICCDSGRSFRKDIAATYKAHRPDVDPVLIEQLRRVQATLEADGFLVVGAEGFEADDVVATFATWAAGPGRGEHGIGDVEILSSDKDLTELASLPSVKIRSVQTNAVLGPTEVEAKFGVPPRMMRDFLALVGDKSDGVAGVAGVGPVHAARLLKEFGTVNGLLEALEGKDADDRPLVKPPAILAALQASARSGALLVDRQLVTLRTDVPIRCEDILEERAPKPQRPDFAAGFPTEEEGAGGSASVDESSSSTETRTVQQGDRVVQEEVRVQTTEARPPPAASADSILAQVNIAPEFSRQLEPRGPQQLMAYAKHLFESRLFSNHKNPEAVMAVILAGRELGIGAMTALRGIDIIKGKVQMGAALMMGLCIARGKAEFFELVESTPKLATYVTKRVGRPREHQMTFELRQAEALGLYPGRRGERNEPTQWEKDPEVMLRHRASSRLARAVYPDVVMGCYLPDEIEEA